MNDSARCFSKNIIELCEEKKSYEMMTFDNGDRIIRYTYDEVLSYCRKLGRLFSNLGITTGDSLVTILPNSPEAIILFFAAMMYGINYAPLPCAVSEREYNNWIKIINPKLIIRKKGIAEYDSCGISQIESSATGELDFVKEIQEISSGNVASESACVYLMTSGTTGVPKAMEICIDKLWNSGMAFVEFHGLANKECRFWNYLPMSYLGGLFNLAIIPLCTKGSFVISEPFSGKTILNFWNFVEKHKIDSLWFVPSIVTGLLRIAKLTGNVESKICERVRTAFLGTAPIEYEQKAEFEAKFGIQLLENFALSETTFLTSETHDNIRFREQASVGEFLPYVRYKLKHIEGIENTSEIWVSTPYLFNGYLSQEGEVSLEVDDEGYFNTKDLGYINDDGILVLCGRDRDIIKKGGMFVSLVEVEHAVKQLDYVEDVAAVPVKHEFYGESYRLYVIFHDSNRTKELEEQLQLWMLDNFVNYKNPESISAVLEFPRTASGKVQKNKLLS